MGQSFFARLKLLWKSFGMWMGDAVARLGLLLVFVFTVVPTHYVWVLIGKDPMKRKSHSELKSYLEKSEPLRDDHWERMF